MNGEIILHQRPITALLGEGSPVQHVHSLGPARIVLPPLPTGRHFFENWPVRELPRQGLWEAEFYDSFAPPVFVLNNVLLHSSAGILAVGDTVIEESLAHANAQDHRFRPLVRGIALLPGEVTELPGTHVSLLAAGEKEYRHAMLHGLARLTAVPENYLLAAESLLVPEGGIAQDETLDLFDLLPTLAVRPVASDETLRVETLIFPLSICGESVYHPCLLDFFARISANVPQGTARLPRRIYLDQRGTGLRPLRNEDAVIAGLGELGFVPVRLDGLSLADQVRLFRQAEAIVAPHGSELTNLGFCRPGCLVVECLMDAYVDWSYRNLAGLADLRYDCVLGRAATPWGELDLQFHCTPWEISVNHVVAAAAHSLDASTSDTAKAA
jgi:capsular polysaccharide biosynthesis protein